jgi:hypothetical protein
LTRTAPRLAPAAVLSALIAILVAAPAQAAPCKDPRGKARGHAKHEKAAKCGRTPRPDKPAKPGNGPKPNRPGQPGTRPDTDGDGWPDDVDRCPTVATAHGADGCPPGADGVQGSADSNAGRRTPRGLTARTARRRRGSRLTLTTTGRLRLPAGVTRTACTGRVQIVVRRGRRALSVRHARLTRTCTFRLRAKYHTIRRGRLTVKATFLGNDLLRGTSARTVRLRRA